MRGPVTVAPPRTAHRDPAIEEATRRAPADRLRGATAMWDTPCMVAPENIRATEEDAAATVLLAGRLPGGDAEHLKPAQFWKLVEHVPHPGVLLGCSENDMVATHALTAPLAAQVAALLGRSPAAAAAVKSLEDEGIEILTPFDASYPRLFTERLGAGAPPVLHIAGDASVLNKPALGAVGSRNPPAGAVDVARACGGAAATEGWPLVSGGAKGVDAAAMNAAIAAGGAAVGFVADSMRERLNTVAVRRAVDAGNVALLTPYSPGTPFSSGVAMSRNRLIYALAAITVVVSSAALSGGTWSGAQAAIERGHGPVAVWRGAGEGPGNVHLERLGGVGVRNMADIFAAAGTQTATAPPPAPVTPRAATLFAAT